MSELYGQVKVSHSDTTRTGSNCRTNLIVVTWLNRPQML